VQQAAASSAAAPTIQWFVAAFYIWIAGMAAFLAGTLARHSMLMKTLGRWSGGACGKRYTALMDGIKKELGISRKVGLQICPAVGSPTLVGCIRPRIILPDGDITDGEAYFIIKHELVHYKRRDLWTKMIALAANAIHWFNPAAYLASRAAAVQAELACDGEVVKNSGPEARRAYTWAVLNAAAKCRRQKTALTTNFYGGKKEMKDRITTIFNTKKKKAGEPLYYAACWYWRWARALCSRKRPRGGKLTVLIRPFRRAGMDTASIRR
jgi:beta-lactamase regulating signal transducer with metallopeptidase domain